MTENFKYNGEWFLPSAKDKKVRGILSYDANQDCVLELLGSFNDKISRQQVDEEIILGITLEGKQITLYRCMKTKFRSSTMLMDDGSKITSTFYSADYILENIHVDSPSELCFQKIASEINNLDEWIGIYGFTSSTDEFSEKHKFSIEYQRPESIKFSIDENLDGEFKFTESFPGSFGYQKEINLKQNVVLIISSMSNYSIDHLLEYLFTFQKFLILALYTETYPNSIVLCRNDITINCSDGTSYEKEIILYSSFPRRNKLKRIRCGYPILFCYNDIKDEFPKIIKRWYEKCEILKPAINLLFQRFYNNGNVLENLFLNLAQAAETFHRRIYSRRGHLEERLEKIMSEYTNEYLDGIIVDKKSFAQQIADSRNYYTHYNPEDEKKALKGEKLIFLTERLKVILACAFLLEAGFDRDKLQKLLERNGFRFFNHLIN